MLNQTSIFHDMTRQEIVLRDNARLHLIPAVVDDVTSGQWFELLLQQIDWQQETYTLYGRQVKAPRLVAWHGDANAYYTYSGIKHRPRAWTALLSEIKRAVENGSRHEFNSVLLNLYRDGNDSVGWHADNEPELGVEPVIASLSLGASRLFKLRHRLTRLNHDILLHQGNLLIMSGDMQSHWQHALPKSKAPLGARINLTFRLIQPLRCKK